MTVLYTVATNDIVAAADVNQFKKMLEGFAGYTSSYSLTSTSGVNFVIKLGDASGANKLIIQDSTGATVASIDSDGNFSGSVGLSAGTLILPLSATPSQTTEGSISWDTDDDVPVVGTGSAAKTIGLRRGAGLSATAAAELAYDTTAGLLKVWNGSASVGAGDFTWIRKAVTETVNNSNTLQNDDEFSFTVVASNDYLVEVFLLLAGNVTADWKFGWALTNMTVDGTMDQGFTPNSVIATIQTIQGTASPAAQGITMAATAMTSTLFRGQFVIHAGATGGTLNFQWAQSTADVSNTQVLKNSSMRYRLLGAT